MSTIANRVKVLIEHDGNSFHAYVPGLQGLHAKGKTEHEAIEIVGGTVQRYISSLRRRGEMEMVRAVRTLIKPNSPEKRPSE